MNSREKGEQAVTFSKQDTDLDVLFSIKCTQQIFVAYANNQDFTCMLCILFYMYYTYQCK